ncbi:MAG: hypothetical protein AAF682_31895 [Planctomycetota bacterium]
MTDPGESLLRSVGNAGLGEAVGDLFEIGLDRVMAEGIARDLPIVGSLIGLAKAGIGARDYLFFKKVARFLSQVSGVSPEQRREFVDSMSSSEFDRAAQHLLLYLERLDSLEKADWLGKAYRAFMLNEIDLRKLQYFTHYLDRVFILVLADYHESLVKRSEGKQSPIHLDDARALQAVGFYEEKLVGTPQLSSDRMQVNISGVRSELELSDAGWDFIRVVFGLFGDDDDARHWLSVSVEGTLGY